MRSCADWLAIQAGFELWTAGALIRVGYALRSLPKIAAAFAEGRLSFDKVRALIEVATPEDEEAWLEVALHVSGSQLGRLCRMFRRVMVTDDPDRVAAQQRKRRLVTWWREDGMLDIFASLPPEDGAVVLNALETAMRTRLPAEWLSESLPADQPAAARRADAFVQICEQWLGGKALDADPASAPRRLVVHVDADALAGTGEGGRCHIEDGPAVAASVARRVGCDSEVETVVERDGVAVDVGRTRRLVTGRMRRLLQLRDGTCRYPGCIVPARDTEGHHIKHWVDGGETSLANMVSLCRFHHHRHHDGAFTISSDGAGVIRFVDGDGNAIGLARNRELQQMRARPSP